MTAAPRRTKPVRDERPFLLTLSKMLRLATDARQGGAFVFLPEPPSEAQNFGLATLPSR